MPKINWKGFFHHKTTTRQQFEEADSQKGINDRLAAAGRGDIQAIFNIGEIVERALLGEFGSVLRATLKGRAAMELNESRVMSKVSAERYLGRLDAYERILDDLEQYVLDKDLAAQRLQKYQEKPEEEQDLHTAPEVGQQ